MWKRRNKKKTVNSLAWIIFSDFFFSLHIFTIGIYVRTSIFPLLRRWLVRVVQSHDIRKIERQWGKIQMKMFLYFMKKNQFRKKHWSIDYVSQICICKYIVAFWIISSDTNNKQSSSVFAFAKNDRHYLKFISSSFHYCSFHKHTSPHHRAVWPWWERRFCTRQGVELKMLYVVCIRHENVSSLENF